VNGRTYFYAVTSYVYNPSASSGLHMLESAPSIVEAVPQTPRAGQTVPARFGQMLSEDLQRVTRTGIKENQVFVRVIDPSAVTGHVYTLTFSKPDSGALWSVSDATIGREVIHNCGNYTKLPYPKYVTQNDPSDPVVDGLQFSVSAPPQSSSYQWTLSTAGLESAVHPSQAAGDLQRINVYPNPYFAANADETEPYGRFVTLNHLPQKAVISILSLSGQRIRTIVKDDPSQFLRWDLMNDNQAQVASGVYIIHIALPESGTQKILKLSVISRVIIPEHW
ncbi:MAG: T9SS type A sorting domain-containing protein, partial [Acidobacteriota bacterium]